MPPIPPTGATAINSIYDPRRCDALPACFDGGTGHTLQLNPDRPDFGGRCLESCGISAKFGIAARVADAPWLAYGTYFVFAKSPARFRVGPATTDRHGASLRNCRDCCTLRTESLSVNRPRGDDGCDNLPVADRDIRGTIRILAWSYHARV
jgi:hypothetical protein